MARFDEVKETFWAAGPDTPGPAITDTGVRHAERRLGVRLPSSLLELLRIRDGGQVAPHWSVFPTQVPNSWSEDHVPFGEMLGISEGAGRSSLLDSAYLAEEWDLPPDLVLLSGDGHYWVALDYRAVGAQGEPSMGWFDADDGTELPLAEDFRAFVERLTCG